MSTEKSVIKNNQLLLLFVQILTLLLALSFTCLQSYQFFQGRHVLCYRQQFGKVVLHLLNKFISNPIEANSCAIKFVWRWIKVSSFRKDFFVFSILPRNKRNISVPVGQGKHSSCQVCFLEELKTPKRHFEINRSLATSSVTFFHYNSTIAPTLTHTYITVHCA